MRYEYLDISCNSLVVGVDAQHHLLCCFVENFKHLLICLRLGGIAQYTLKIKIKSKEDDSPHEEPLGGSMQESGTQMRECCNQPE